MSEVDKAINLLRNASADWGIHRTHRNAAAAQHEHFKVLEAEERLRAQFEATRSRVRQMEEALRLVDAQVPDAIGGENYLISPGALYAVKAALEVGDSTRLEQESTDA